METWLTTNFEAAPGGVLVYQDATDSVIFDAADPNGVFASITTTPPTYAALSALPVASQGWQKIFDQWKAAGKVS